MRFNEQKEDGGASPSFNRGSQDIPENRRTPNLPGMSGEERVSHSQHAFVVGDCGQTIRLPADQLCGRARQR